MRVKRIVLLALLGLIAVGFCGCKKKEAPPAGNGGMEKMATKMKKEAAEMGETAKEAMVEAKDAFVSECQTQMDQMKEKFSEMKAKADSEGAEAQKQYNELKADFDKKMDAAAKEIGKVKKASADAWMDMKAGASKVMDEMKAAYDKAAARFAGK